jgi:hypothetical protein
LDEVRVFVREDFNPTRVSLRHADLLFIKEPEALHAICSHKLTATEYEFHSVFIQVMSYRLDKISLGGGHG